MMPVDELYLDDFRDIREVLIVQNPIDVVPALLAKLFISPELPGLLVFGLQFV